MTIERLKFRIAGNLSIRAAVRDLLQQARKRQSDIPGSRYEGAVLQHLVGAKLELVLAPKTVMHCSASENDKSHERPGDFAVGDVAIHVTTNPSEALLGKCKENIEAGLRPMIITSYDKVPVPFALAEPFNIQDQIEVLDIEQFLAANVHERSFFQKQGRHTQTADLIRRYNHIIDTVETDPALKIDVAS